MEWFNRLFFPKWKVTSSRVVIVTMHNPLFKNEWTEEKVLEIQQNRFGDKRAFFVSANKRTEIEYSFVSGMLGD